MSRINGNSNNNNNNRAFSLPPENINSKAHYIPIKATNINPQQQSRTPGGGNNERDRRNIKARQSNNNNNNKNYSSLDWDEKHDRTDSETMLQETLNNFDNITRQFMGLSPSLSSLNSNEDSGYVRTPFGNRKLADSANSVFNSGHTASEDSTGGSSSNKDEFILVMIEDLVDWFTKMYPNMASGLNSDNFFDRLSDGVLLCHYATELHNRLAAESGNTLRNSRPIKLANFRVGGVQAILPPASPVYQTRGLNSSNAAVSFISRDNVSNFIRWCRQLGMRDSTLFESEDLVCRKNPRNVVVCLLELARLGGRVGMSIPEIVQLEVEIDEQLARENLSNESFNRLAEEYSLSNRKTNGDEKNKSINTSQLDRHNRENNVDLTAENNNNNNNNNSNDNSSNDSQTYYYRSNRSTELRRQQQQQQQNRQLSKSRVSQAQNPSQKQTKDTQEDKKQRQEIQRPAVDFRSLDELVRELLSQCTCKQTFPMTRIGEGRYLFGDKSTQIFVRILRNHVMVRVGGGWDTLSHFLSKYDECRKVNPVTSSKIVPSNQNGNCPQVDTKDKNNLIKAVKDSKHMGKYLSNGELNKDFIEGRLNAVKKRTSSSGLQENNNNNNTSECQVEKHQQSPGRYNSEYRNEFKKCTMDYSTPKKETGILSKSKFFSEINLSTLNDDEVNCTSHLPRYKITGGRYTHNNNNNIGNNKTSSRDNDDVYTRDNNRMRNPDNENMNDIQSTWHMNECKSSNSLYSSDEKLCTSTPVKQKFDITIIRPSVMQEQMEEQREQQKNYANRSYLPKDAYYIHSPRMWSNNTDSRNNDYYPVQKGMSNALISQDFSKSLTSLHMIPKQSTNRRNSKPLELVSVLTTTNTTTDEELRKSHPHPYGGLHQSSSTARKYSAPTRSTLITADYPVKGKKSALKNSKASNSNNNNNSTVSSNQSKSQTKRGRFSSVFSPKTPPPSRTSKTGKAVSSSTSTKHIDPQSDYKPVQIVYNSEENENYDRFDNNVDDIMNRRHYIMSSTGRHSDNSNKDHNGQIIAMESQSRRGSLIPVSTRSYSTSRIPVRQH